MIMITLALMTKLLFMIMVTPILILMTLRATIEWWIMIMIIMIITTITIGNSQRGFSKGGFSNQACFQFTHENRNLMYYNCTKGTHKLLNPPLLNPPLRTPEIMTQAWRPAARCASSRTRRSRPTGCAGAHRTGSQWIQRYNVFKVEY